MSFESERTSSTAKEAITRVSAMGKYGLGVKTVIREEPRMKSRSSSQVASTGLPVSAGTETGGLALSVLAHRKSGFHSSLGHNLSQVTSGQSQGQSGKTRTAAATQQTAVPETSTRAPSVQAPRSSSATSAAEAGAAMDESGIVFSDRGSSSPVDVELCLGLTGPLKVDGKEDTIIRDTERLFVK